MRVLSLLAAAAVFLTAAVIPIRASAQIDSIVLHADRIGFYNNKYVITADDNVRVQLSDGTTITGNSFAMDLKQNRFLIAGAVHFVHGALRYDGAAFSEFLDYKRAYFLPITTEPDRWTFLDENYTKPAPGREMPGDTFDFPNTGVDHPLVLAKEAHIYPKTGVSFRPASVYVLGAYAPTPEYYFNFSANPYFMQNSLAGATGAVGYPFMGSKNATTTLYGRYDSTNHQYLAIEENLATQNSYAVFSISPLTRPNKQYNLLASVKTENQRFQITDFDQMFTYQSGFSQPLSEGALETEQLTYGFQNSFLQILANQYQDTLLPRPTQGFYGNPTDGAWIPNHPTNAELSWVGSNQAVSKYVPINFKFRGGILTAHEGYGLGSFNGTPYTSYWQNFLGFTVWSNPIRLTPHAAFDQSVYYSETYDRQRTFVQGFPRFQDAGTLTSTLSKMQGHKGSMYLSYIVSNQGDYLGGLQGVFYPPTVIDNPFNNMVYPGYASFRGFSTLRDLQYAYTFIPTSYFSFTVQADKHDDYPVPIPYYYGQAPYSIAMRTQFRISPILSLSVGKSYFFNFGNMGWSQWTVQFGP